MSYQKCLDAVSRAAGDRTLTDDEQRELFEYVQRLRDRAARDNVGDLEAEVLAAVDQAITDAEIVAKIEARNAALNRIKRLEMLDYIWSNWQENLPEGLVAVLGGVATAKRGAKLSVFVQQESLANHYLTGMIAALEKGGVHRIFVSGELDREIWTAMHALDTGDTAKLRTLPNAAIKVAEILNRYNEAARVDANLAGAWIKKLPGRVIKQTHDQYRIYRDEAGWRAFMEEHLDMDETFGDLPLEKRAEALSDIYTQLSTGVHVQFKPAPTDGLKGPANIGRKMSHDRALHFKSPEAGFEYNTRFGVGRLAEGMLYGLERMGQNTGLMRALGPNAEANVVQVADEIRKRLTKAGRVDDLKRFDDAFNAQMKNVWPQLDGSARVPGNATAAQASAIARAIQQWSKLGSAVLSAVSDIPFYGSEVRYQGRGLLSGMAEAIGGLLEGRTSAEKKEIVGMLGVLYDGMRASAATRFDADDRLPGAITRGTQLFFKLNGLRWWTDRLRVNMALSMSHRFALNAGKTFDELGPEMTRLLGLYGLDAGKWDLLRAGTSSLADGRAYMTPEGLDDVADEAFGAYLQSHGQSPTAARIRDLRREIAEQWRSMHYDRSTTAVIEPDARTRGWLLRGTKPGTVEGEVLRHVMLFKSFSASVIQKVIGRELYGRSDESVRGLRGLATALGRGNGEFQGLASLIVWNTIFGYGAMALKDLAKGRTPRDPESLATWNAAMLQGGGLGIYGDFLFGDLKNRYGSNALSTFMGPTFSDANTVFDIFAQAKAGDPAAGEFLRFAVNHLPNTFYTKWAMDYAIAYEIAEHFSPGYLRRLERRIKQENDQEFIVPPSSVVGR